MKLTARDIAGFLNIKPTAAVVLIYGPDHGLGIKRADMVAKHIVADLHDPFNVADLTGDQITSDPARFFDETSAMSMMGGDRLVRVKNATDGLTATLKSYLASPVRGTTVILIAGELPAKSTLRKLCEGDKNAVALPCYVQDAGDVARVINDTVRTAGLKIDPDATAFLSTAIAGDHGQITSELDKLLTYMNVGANGQGEGTVTYTDAVACSGALGLAQLDSFIDAFLGGDTKTAFALLPKLEDDGVNMIAILRSLMAHGRKLHSTHLRIAAGERLDDMLNDKFNPPVFFKRKAAFTAQINRWPLPRLQILMNDFLVLEGKMKSGRDAGATLPQGLLSLAARAQKRAA